MDQLQTRGCYVLRDASRGRLPAWYLLCTSCDGVTSVEDGALEAAIRSAAGKHDFTPLTSHLEIVGRCRSC